MAEAGGGDARVGVVTDSTACLTPQMWDEFADLVRVVPLSVTLGDETFVEESDVSSEQVVAAQREGVSVTTSRPSPDRFLIAYTELAASGCTHIVSVHASAALSSTLDSARLAALDSPVPVNVLDSRTLGMALGFGVLEAARAASRGSDGSVVAAIAQAAFEGSRTAFYVDSLEPLRRGGRIGRASALVGSALSIKPLLHVHGGVIEPLARVRSSRKAVERLAQWAGMQIETAGPAGAWCAVHSLANEELAGVLFEALQDRVGDGIVRAPLGSVVTAHVGAGALAVAVVGKQNEFVRTQT